ncbi:methyltransferase domain-containing protein [Chryseolinea sp. T2]|uniref:class I SAM-dependent methyltransferase n=1 Tax=Chryseolinea sp. T2 TaxID=3129255 RepID=UPI0030780DA5
MKKQTRKLTERIEKRLTSLILGQHPHNTIFSFNYHNVVHINAFLREQAKRIGKVDTVTDVGAGRSPYYPIFGHLSENYIAVDLKESLPHKEHRKIKQLYGLAEDLPMQSQSSDVVLSNQVLEHVINPEKAVNEVFRVLRPGGFIVGSVPHISPVHLEPYDFRRFTDLGVQKLMMDAGFSEIEVFGNGSIYRAFAFSMAMDWMLSSRRPGKAQYFSVRRALLLSPLVGMLNLAAIVFEFITRNKNRSAANLCWIARKPLV